MAKPFIIGVAGGSGSGKTFFLKCLKQHFNPDDICVISQDDYYRHVSDDMTREENKLYNFDLPATIDDEHFLKDIRSLIAGQPVEKLEYNFHNASAAPKTLLLKPAPILLIEGLFLFHFQQISELVDIKIFLEADDALALQRRLDRDLKERGYSYDDVMYKWINHVRPAYQDYLLPYKPAADVIITNNSNDSGELFYAAAELVKQVTNRS